MADTLFSKSVTKVLEPFEPVVLIRRLVFGIAFLTLFLMALGSATRVMNAGLACPDWPLCYGELVPKQEMNLQVFLEWFHRLVASSIGILAIAFAGLTWWQRKVLPKWLPLAAVLSLGLVIVQGVLGGLTVTQLLNFGIVTAHLGTGLLFFTLVLAIGMALLPYQGTGVVGNLPWFGWGAVLLVYLQSILGGLTSSQWAFTRCINNAGLCNILNSHLIGVIPASVSTIVLVFLAWRTPALHPLLRRLAYLAIAELGMQITLGVSTYRLQLQVPWLTVAHQAMGAALLGTLVAFSVIALRDRKQATQLSTIPSQREAGTLQGS